jgi:methylmalonyl-CoA/ethylmalonyl-CoA epimerase
MAYTRINHIGVAVRDLDAALAVWRDALGLPLSDVEEVAAQKVRVAFFRTGESRIELVCPTAEGTGVAGFLEKRGEGVHHVALEVDDIEKALADLRGRGVRLIDEVPVKGAHGTRVAFLHPKGTTGVLIELVESAR